MWPRTWATTGREGETGRAYSQFVESDSMTFFFSFSFSFLSNSSCLVFSCFSCLFLFFPFRFCFFCFAFFSFLLFSLLLFSNFLASFVRMRSDRYYVWYIRGNLSWVESGFLVGFSRQTWVMTPVMDLAYRRLTPNFTFICSSWWNDFRQLWYIHACVPPWVVCDFPWGTPQLQSDWSLSCDHGLD